MTLTFSGKDLVRPVLVFRGVSVSHCWRDRSLAGTMRRMGLRYLPFIFTLVALFSSCLVPSTG